MNCTLHTTWPIHVDYPLFRKALLKYKEIIPYQLVSLSDNHESLDLTSFIKTTLSTQGVSVFDPPTRNGEDDWRDRTIKQAYGNFSSEWIWFTEPDFFIANPEAFFRRIEEVFPIMDMISYREAERIHPACIFVRKSIADRTARDFGALPGTFDHFGRFTSEVVKFSSPDRVIGLETLDLNFGKDYFHMTGLTHNYSRFKQRLTPTGTTDFLTYNHFARMVSSSEEFSRLLSDIEESLGSGYPESELGQLFFKPLIT